MVPGPLALNNDARRDLVTARVGDTVAGLVQMNHVADPAGCAAPACLRDRYR